MDGLEQEIQEGLQAAFKGAVVDTEGENFQNIASNFQAPEAAEVKKEEVVSSEAPATESAKEEVPVIKSWDEQFTEKTGGKFKNWEEVESLLNTPKEEYDDEIKHLAELKKSGIKFDNDFWELKTKDYEKLSDPVAILKETMKWKPEYKGWSDEEIDYEIRTKYKQSEWSEEGEQPNELETMMSKRMLRDSQNDKQWLIDKKNTLLTVNKPDEAAIKLRQDQADLYQRNWEKFVEEEVFAKTTKLSVKLDEKESFDYDVSDSDKREAAAIMKQMPKDISVFWNLFKDSKGELNHQKVYDLILWNKNKDNIVKIAHQKAINKGAEKEFKTIKNTSYTPNESKSTQTSDWRAKAVAEMEKHL